ncbi:MAG: hypothetical protein ACREBW_03735 [Candidatus Micrarchaeaceae archaeon]
MFQIIIIILSFILTIVIGGKIAQARQQDGWIAQQRFSGEEKEYFELKKLCDEIASSLGSRIYAMQRLFLQLAAYSKSAKFDRSSLAEYKEAIKSWNEVVNSYYVRLSQLKQTPYRYKLESKLHRPMQVQGSAIDKVVREMDQGCALSGLVSIGCGLEIINKSSIMFNESLLREVHELRVKIYFPKRIKFAPYTMYKFSTWQLIKAIFVTDVNRISIIRSPLDP